MNEVKIFASSPKHLLITIALHIHGVSFLSVPGECPCFDLLFFVSSVCVASFFPATVFPATVFPAPVFPAPVFPASVFPATVFPAQELTFKSRHTSDRVIDLPNRRFDTTAATWRFGGRAHSTSRRRLSDRDGTSDRGPPCNPCCIESW